MKNTSMICITISMTVSVFAGVVQAQSSDAAEIVDRLVESDYSSDLLDDLKVARRAVRDHVPGVTEELTLRLRETQEPEVVMKLCSVLSESPPADALNVMTARVAEATDFEEQLYACRALGMLIRGKIPDDQQAVQAALELLDGVVRSPNVSGFIKNEAVVAIARFRSLGFDRLSALYQEAPEALAGVDVRYTALAETGDIRAIPLLLEATQNENQPVGDLRRATYALDRAILSATRQGMAIQPNDTAACAAAMRALIAFDVDDQLSAAALKCYGSVANSHQDPLLKLEIADALLTASPYRRLAALEALYYEQKAPTDELFISLIKDEAEHGSNAAIRAQAEAVLVKHELIEQELPIPEVALE